MIGYIYKTTNLKTGKIYIGQHLAEKFEPEKYIGSGCLFKKIVERDGKENFVCELLKECYSLEELNESEKQFITIYNSQDRSIGYNIADGGEEPWNRGKIMTEESRQKTSEAKRRIAPSISCYDFETGKLLQVFNSCYDAAEFLQPNITTPLKTVATRIHAVCTVGKGHAYGYIWRHETKYLGVSQLNKQELTLEHLPAKAKKVGQYDKNGTLLQIWESAASYSKTITEDYNKQRNIAKTVCNACRGVKVKSYKGYIWKFL
jgi:hypothetical protein